MNIEEQIVWKANELMMQLGVKRVTMDTVAEALGISKKTIYQYYSDKNTLIDKCIDQQIEFYQKNCEASKHNNGNAIDHLVGITLEGILQLSKINPVLFYDLQKFYPLSWNKFLDFRNDFLLNQIIENLIEGKKEGLFDENIHPQLTAQIHLHNMDMILIPKDFSKTNQEQHQLLNCIIWLFIRSICSVKGLQYFEKTHKETYINNFNS